MHEKLLSDVIRRQAGTLTKAILEGVMNSADARATACYVDATATQVTIRDDGVGVTTRDEIDRCLLTMGQPHEDAEQKIYGRFRMGRGQMWAFGRNTWRTGPFRLVFDIDNKGFDVDIENVEPTRGCSVLIELYRSLGETDLLGLRSDLQKAVAFSPMPVFFNGEQLSKAPGDAAWTHQTEDAYVRLDETVQLRIYNMGMFVTSFEADRFGSGGVISTKVPLQVNYARNDIMSDCPVWERLRALLSQIIDRTVKDAKRLTEPAKHAIIRRVIGGTDIDGAKQARLFQLSDGRWLTARALWDMTKLRPVCSAPLHDRRADKLLQLGRAVCLCSGQLAALNCSAEDYVFAAGRIAVGARAATRSAVASRTTFSTVSALWGRTEYDNELVPACDYTATERVWVRVLASMAAAVHQYVTRDDMGARRKGPRRIVIGRSQSACAWTDGEAYVAFDREYLRTTDMTVRGIARVASTLCHEYAHEAQSVIGGDTCHHGTDFYVRQAELVDNTMPDAIVAGLAALRRAFASESRRLPKTVARTRDSLAELAAVAGQAGAHLQLLLNDGAAVEEEALCQSS